MSQVNQVINKNLNKNLDENILVVKRENLLKNNTWHGIKQANINEYLEIINQHKEFLPRAQMEEDTRYKQIIPYLVFTHENKYFLMQRQAKATEQRLKNKFSLGIGGHIRQEDLTSNSIIDWAKREFEEEINYNNNYTVKLLGLLNDDSNSVGQVHIGLILLLQGDSDLITVKSELKSGELLTLSQCQQYYNSMESWSQIVFDFLN